MFGVLRHRREWEQVLARTSGGLAKRVDENRELLELLYAEAPRLLDQFPWVVGRLRRLDQFFLDLSGFEASPAPPQVMSWHYVRSLPPARPGRERAESATEPIVWCPADFGLPDDVKFEVTRAGKTGISHATFKDAIDFVDACADDFPLNEGLIAQVLRGEPIHIDDADICFRRIRSDGEPVKSEPHPLLGAPRPDLNLSTAALWSAFESRPHMARRLWTWWHNRTHRGETFVLVDRYVRRMQFKRAPLHRCARDAWVLGYVFGATVAILHRIGVHAPLPPSAWPLVQLGFKAAFGRQAGSALAHAYSWRRDPAFLEAQLVGFTELAAAEPCPMSLDWYLWATNGGVPLTKSEVLRHVHWRMARYHYMVDASGALEDKQLAAALVANMTTSIALREPMAS